MNNRDTLDYHTLMAIFLERLRRGEFGAVTWAATFSGTCNSPIQVGLRDMETQVVHLWNLNQDGTLTRS